MVISVILTVGEAVDERQTNSVPIVSILANLP